MSKKAFDVSVEIDIHAITCPGVWLSPNGKITLCIFMLDSCSETSQLEPVFPLLCHEKFIFYKTIHTARSLIDLQEDLSDQFLYVELVQWADCYHQNGCVLANFQSSLSDLLYPTLADRELMAGVDVDLLMDACKCFPGIIAPKVELSTRTTIREVIDKCGKKRCSCATHVVNPKLIASKRTTRRSPTPKKRNCCQTFDYCEPCRPCSPCGKTPFVIQIQKKKKKCKSPLRREHSPRKRCKSPRARSPRPHSCSPAKHVCPCHDTSESLWDILNLLKTSPRCARKDLIMKCFCGQNNNTECDLCYKYKKYFNNCLEDTSEVQIPANIQSNDFAQSNTTAQLSNQPEVITEEQYKNVQHILQQRRQSAVNNRTSISSERPSQFSKNNVNNRTSISSERPSQFSKNNVNNQTSISSERPSQFSKNNVSNRQVGSQLQTVHRGSNIPVDKSIRSFNQPSSAPNPSTQTFNRESIYPLGSTARGFNNETNLTTESEVGSVVNSSNSPTINIPSTKRNSRSTKISKDSRKSMEPVVVQNNIDNLPTSSLAETIHLRVDKVLKDDEVTLFNDTIYTSVPEKEGKKKRILKSNCNCGCCPIKPCSCHVGNINQTYRSLFYENLEKFYKTLYKRAREKALAEAKLNKKCKCSCNSQGLFSY